jgi:hypothetical protein
VADDEEGSPPPVPDQLDAGRHRDVPNASGAWVRRAVLAVFVVFVAAALLGAFGQGVVVSHTAGSAATLRVSAPTSLRGGLLFGARIDVQARRRIRRPTLVLGSGWTDGLTLNTVEPAPASETTVNGELALSFDTLNAGDLLRVFLQYQVNPTTVGRKAQDVQLREGDRALLDVDRNLTIYP